MILGPDGRRARGMPEPWAFGIADAMRCGEIDAPGHVDHAALFTWFE